MKTQAMRRLAVALLVLVAGACARHEAPPVGVAVAGGNMPALPPLAPQDAKLEPAALEAAANIARYAGSDALLIARNGHLLLERYWHDTTFATPVAAGAWQGVIDDLLVGALVNDRRLIDTEALPSRGAIEQAKGALMGLLGCDAEQAWSVLRRASQEFNVKLRELAVALIEHISGAPAEQPGVSEPIAPNQPARDAARLMWTAISKER